MTTYTRLEDYGYKNIQGYRQLKKNQETKVVIKIVSSDTIHTNSLSIDTLIVTKLEPSQKNVAIAHRPIGP